MTLTKEQRVAIYRILTDILVEMGGGVGMEDSRHYQILKTEAGLTEADKEAAVHATVLSSLAILKEVHYKVKMMLGMTVCEFYSEDVAVPLNHRRAFEILMAAIDWPISFAEIHALS